MRFRIRQLTIPTFLICSVLFEIGLSACSHKSRGAIKEDMDKAYDTSEEAVKKAAEETGKALQKTGEKIEETFDGDN